MTRWIASSLLAASILAAVGCASTESTTSATAQADCERTGGLWRTAVNYCEYTAPEGPTTPGAIRR